MKAFAFARPVSVEQTLALLSPTKRPKGGGFDLLDLSKRGVSTPEVLVDLSRVKGEGGGSGGSEAPPRNATARDGLLEWMAGDHGEITMGARTTLATLASSKDVAERCPALADAAREAATPQIRAAATIAGNLLQRPRCAYFRDPFFDCLKRGGTSCPAMDGIHDEMAIFGNGKCCATHPSNIATALAALRGEVLIARNDLSNGVTKVAWRSVEVGGDFFIAPEKDASREADVAPGEVVWNVTVPNAPASAYVEINHKQSYDWAQVSCCAVLDVFGGKVRGARIVLGAVAPVPWRVEAAEQAITGKSVGDTAALAAAAESAVKGATPLRDNAHKVRLAKVVVRRAIEAALARAK